VLAEQTKMHLQPAVKLTVDLWLCVNFVWFSPSADSHAFGS